MRRKTKSPFGFKSVIELVSYFKDEKNCLEYLEESKWKGHITCAKCNGERICKFKDGKRYKCLSCGNHFTAKVGTIFQDSKIPMMKWFIAMHFLNGHKKGLSSRQLAAEINVSQRTAWFMQHRIRESFICANDKLSGVVEIDETFVGGKNKNRHMDKRVAISKDRTYKDKIPVVGMLETGGRLKCVVVKDTTRPSLEKAIFENIVEGAIIVTDEWRGYNEIKARYHHQSIDHSRRKYVNDNGFTTNGIEGFWTHLKKSLVGIYHRVTPKHLHRYVTESEFRYNFRHEPPHIKLDIMMQNINRPLKYKTLIKNEEAA